MFEKLSATSKEENYKYMVESVKCFLDGELNFIANLSNISAIINIYLEEINWVGFYLIDENNKSELVLGPFQGKPACIRIKLGKGVCGTSAKEKRTIIVENVEEFEGHIACDSDSKSEIVIPIYKNNEVIGILDIDSPIINRFTNTEKEYLEQIVKILESKI